MSAVAGLPGEPGAAPVIRTTVMGSYPIPDWLPALPSRQSLADATAVVLHLQELAGIDVLADGELSRFDVNHPETNGMIDYFVRPMAGVRTEVGREELRQFREQAGMSYRTAPAGVIEGPLGEGTLNLPRDFAGSRALTRRPLKLTLTSPYMLTRVLVDRHYGCGEAVAMALAEVLAEQVAEVEADLVQIDEANLPGSPDDRLWAADAINHVLDAVRGETAVHLCFGNYGGQTIQRGTWAALIDFMNRLRVDHLHLEFAHRGYAELERFRELRSGLGLGLGVVDVKSTVVETPEEIARRLEHAERVLGPGRVTFVHPDCGFWMLKRSVADAKTATLVRGRDLYLQAGSG